MERYRDLAPVSILSFTILLSIVILAFVWKSAKSAEQTITVTGSAKKTITSDLGIQRVSIQVVSYDRKTAYQQLVSQAPTLINFLDKKGIKKDQVEMFPINGYSVNKMNDNGYPTNEVSHYVYSQRFEIKDSDVNKIKYLSLQLVSLVESGLDIQVDSPEYLYSKIDDEKVVMQAEAAKNAMERAQKVAESTGRDLGPLRNARMGVIQITPPNSNMISDYGVNDNTSIIKEINAVVSASFEID
ncbi:MAG: SIMPL domain-containing protein [Ignavibacteriaceae bacterium]|jgi:hypothetical protein|nr:SIMPL domain-containing protein [Ignavibacteriaceae bacterium]